MLALNGKPIKEWPANDPLRKQVEAALERIKQKPIWKLVFHPSKIRPPIPGMPGSFRETNAGINQRATGKYGFDGMEHDITYYKRISGMGDKKKYLPPRVDFSGITPLNPKIEADLIFLMTCVFSTCAPYPFLKDFQYIKSGNYDYFYKVEDLVADAKVDNVLAKMVAKVGTLIYDDNAGLSIKEIRKLAASQGIPDSDSVELNLLRHKLKVLILSKKKGQYQIDRIETFLADAVDGSFAALRAVIAYAIKNKLIMYANTLQGKPAWYTTDDGKKKLQHLYSCPVGSDSEISLAQFYIKRPTSRAAFEKYVEKGQGKEKVEVEKVNEHVIEEVEPVE